MPKLEGAKPCPFCGDDAINLDVIDGEVTPWCTNCSAQGPSKHFGPDGTAAGAWNDTRAGESDDLDAMRARAEAAETRAALAEAAVDAWRDLLLSRVRERCGDPDLHTDRPGTQRDPEHRLWRVVSHRGVAGVGHTEAEALLRAFDAVRPDVLARAAEVEAVGYRRAVDAACAALDAAANELMAGGMPEWGGYARGRLDGLRDVERDVRKLAPRVATDPPVW